MIKRWIHCLVALNEHNEVVGTIYDAKQTLPFPIPKTPTKGKQTLEKLPRIDLIHHPPMSKVTIAERDRAYGNHI